MAKIVSHGSPTHRAWQGVWWLLAAAIALAIPMLLEDFRITLFTKAIAYAVAVLGLNLVTGYSGQVSLGHSAFFGVGAYTTTILVSDHEWPYLLTVVVAAVLGLIVGFIVGLPALRIKGLYLALVTLGVAVVFPVLVIKYGSTTGGGDGKRMEATRNWDPPGWVPFMEEGDSRAWIYWTVLACAAVVFWLSSNLVRSRVGRALIALRDNETGAAVSGVWLSGYKTGAFAFGAMVASVAGALFMLPAGVASPESFALLLAIQLITGIVVGGIATISGAVIGGLLIVFLPYYTADWGGGAISNVIYGVILIVIMFAMPGGVVWAIRQARAKAFLVIPDVGSPGPPDSTPVPPEHDRVEDTPTAIPTTQGGKP